LLQTLVQKNLPCLQEVVSIQMLITLTMGSSKTMVAACLPSTSRPWQQGPSGRGSDTDFIHEACA
jgi:hypothetical protein